MKQVAVCEICRQEALGKYYPFYYGQFLGTTDVHIGGPGSINTWKEHYNILGQSGGFICKKCISQEYWKRVFKEERLDEFKLRWFDPFLFFVGIGIGILVLYGGGFKLLEWLGISFAFQEPYGLIFFLISMAFIIAAVLLILKLNTYSQDFGTEMAYRIKRNELPRNPQLICIPPWKQRLLKPPGADQQKKPAASVKPTAYKDLESMGKSAIQKKKTAMKLATKSVAGTTCTNCGNVGEPNDRFCRRCGASLQSPTAAAKKIPNPEPENKCPKCGRMPEPDDRFCRRCGSPLK